jgi:hypothetical protein
MWFSDKGGRNGREEKWGREKKGEGVREYNRLAGWIGGGGIDEGV